MLKPLMPRFHPHLSVSLMDVAKKQVPVKLKPIVGEESLLPSPTPLTELLKSC